MLRKFIDDAGRDIALTVEGAYNVPGFTGYAVGSDPDVVAAAKAASQKYRDDLKARYIRELSAS